MPGTWSGKSSVEQLISDTTGKTDMVVQGMKQMSPQQVGNQVGRLGGFEMSIESSNDHVTASSVGDETSCQNFVSRVVPHGTGTHCSQ